MAFTYTPSATPSDRDRVRFHVGDTVEAQHYLEDEDIEMLLAEAGTWQRAVIGGLKYIIARLSQPNFRADWLQVDHKSAREGYERMLVQKRQEFGIAAITATAVSVRRSDSVRGCEPTIFTDLLEDCD
jgi:hypothetical protein